MKGFKNARARPEGDRAGRRDGSGGPLLLFFLLLLSGGYADFHLAGLRWSRTYSSVPVELPLLVPDGWQES
jgi:hypothetical protein